MKMKMVLSVALIAISSLISASAFAATLSFMTSEGKSAIKDAAKIVSVQTFLTLKNNSQSVDYVSVIVKDANGNSCHINQNILPGTDMVALTLNLRQSSVILGCEISSPFYPGAGAEKYQVAKTVWFGDVPQ